MVMDDRRAQIPLMKLIIRCLSLILMLSLRVTHAADCKNRLDIVIAVDTTSSQTASSFENVKTEVKGIVSGFTIGQTHTRLALVSISKQARVVVNFDGVKSVSDFNAAVDTLTFSTDLVELSEGIKVTRDSVLSTARARKTNKILIMVKDRRSGNAAVSGTAELSRMTSESAAVRVSGAVIHAVGIGGLWNIQELASLYGTEYLLFKDKNKAMESVKSLNNKICLAACPNNGASNEQSGLCYGLKNHVISTKVALTENSAGDSVCRRTIKREFNACSGKASCNAMDRKVSTCDADGKVAIEDTWQSFDQKLQSCIDTKSTHKVKCADAKHCFGQVADVIFVLDKSGSMDENFRKVKEATRILVESLNIGPDNVHIGVIIFSNDPEVSIEFGSVSETAAVMKAIQAIPDAIDPFAETFTDKALKMVREIFRDKGRADVPKFVFIITDGGSTQKARTFAEIDLVKNAGITVYAIGVAAADSSELKTMSAPESDTNMFFAKDFDELQKWSKSFSKRMCIQLSPPHPKLCEDAVFVQSISACTHGQQQLTSTEYKFNVAKKCIKTLKSTLHKSCRPVCTSPIDGNQYFEGERLTSLCHELHQWQQCAYASELKMPGSRWNMQGCGFSAVQVPR